MTRAYTTIGPVRGGCGHRHRYLHTAAACAERDWRACDKQGGYSDRDVVPADGGALTQDEMYEVVWLRNGGLYT